MLTSKMFRKSCTNEAVPIRCIPHTCDIPPPPHTHTKNVLFGTWFFFKDIVINLLYGIFTHGSLFEFS